VFWLLQLCIHLIFLLFFLRIALARLLALEFIHYSYFLRFLFFSLHSLALSLSYLCTSYFLSFFPSPLLIPLFHPSFFLLQFLFLVHIYLTGQRNTRQREIHLFPMKL